MNWLFNFFNSVWATIDKTLIVKERWRYIVTGLGNTLKLTFLALLLGVVLGIVVALIRSSWEGTGRTMRGMPKLLLGFFNFISKIYLTVIRGTPVVVQVMIIFYVIMESNDKVLAGVIAFGINSGAYVAEIVRGGIMSLDAGQTEAGRSLGFNYVQTMRYIVLPQSFKNILPALANEFIVLLKETSVVGFIGLVDLNKASDILIGQTFDAVGPLLTVAAVYLTLVSIFTWLVSILERRLKGNER